MRTAVYREIEKFNAEEYEASLKYLDEQLSVFKEGEKYDYVKDLKDAFKDGLSRSTADKILDTIPLHAFWDIKVPR